MCSNCLEGKISKLPFQSATHKSLTLFDVIQSDVWDPTPCLSIEGFKYYVTFIDECTPFCWIFLLINKDEVYSTFVTFYQFILNHFSISIQTLQSDEGGDYVGKQFKSFLATKGD